jgi:CDP-glucose 4,6-dehydratase
MSKKSAIIRNPKSIRPWSYVLDIIIGYLIIGLDCIEKKPSFNSYNLSPLQKSSFTVLDLANKFLNKFDKRNPVVVDDLVEFKEKKFLKLSSNKIYKELNWSNQISFEDTVKLTAQWYQEVLSGLSPLKVTENNIKDYLQILNTKEKIYAS